MDELSIIAIKADSLEALHDKVGEMIESLYEMQDEIAERIEREQWFAWYLRGPFWWL